LSRFYPTRFRISEHPKAYVIDFSAVHILDSTAAATIDGFVDKARRHGTAVYIAGAMPRVRRVLLVHGVKPPQVRFKRAVADAVLTTRGRIAFEDRLQQG
jgi:SulP family sulfate permease